MQSETITQAATLQTAAINELQFGSNINAAVEQNRRADFALLLAMFSEDVRETTSIEDVSAETASEQNLRNQLNVPAPQALHSDADSYSRSAQIANQFHQGGFQSAQLQMDLCPDALACHAENTHGLGEEVYRNLSFHAQRSLSEKTKTAINNNNLYQQLVTSGRTDTISRSFA